MKRRAEDFGPEEYFSNLSIYPTMLQMNRIVSLNRIYLAKGKPAITRESPNSKYKSSFLVGLQFTGRPTFTCALYISSCWIHQIQINWEEGDHLSIKLMNYLIVQYILVIYKSFYSRWWSSEPNWFN